MVNKIEIERVKVFKFQCDICKKAWFTKHFAEDCENSHNLKEKLQ